MESKRGKIRGKTILDKNQEEEVQQPTNWRLGKPRGISLFEGGERRCSIRTKLKCCSRRREGKKDVLLSRKGPKRGKIWALVSVGEPGEQLGVEVQQLYWGPPKVCEDFGGEKKS